MAKRFHNFLDPDTIENNLDNPMALVRTMDNKIIHNLGLMDAITLGLNHILLININIQETIQMVVDILFASLSCITDRMMLGYR